jgi:hypothetical protein
LRPTSTPVAEVCDRLLSCEANVRPVFRSVNRIGSSERVRVMIEETSSQVAGAASGVEPGGLKFSGNVTRSVWRPAMYIARLLAGL